MTIRQGLILRVAAAVFIVGDFQVVLALNEEPVQDEGIVADDARLGHPLLIKPLV